MDWVDRPQNYKGLYGILQLFARLPFGQFSPEIKLGWVAFHSLTFQLKCLDFQSNKYKKLAPVLSRFCNWLYGPGGCALIKIQGHPTRNFDEISSWRAYPF